MNIPYDKKLKPCPFCGGEVILISQEKGDSLSSAEYYNVECEHCELDFGRYNDTKEQVIEAWNRRA